MFFKEMKTLKLVPQTRIYSNEELKLMNWKVEAFDGQWCDGPIPKFSTFNFHDRNWEVKLFVALISITAFGTWFGVAKPFLRSHVWDITNKKLEASHGYILGPT